MKLPIAATGTPPGDRRALAELFGVPIVDLTDARTEDVNERLDRIEEGMAKLHERFDRLSKAMNA